ncbi:MAG: PEP-CTERM sorting domain-containing protein [Verrucomicrobiota bacterium]
MKVSVKQFLCAFASMVSILLVDTSRAVVIAEDTFNGVGGSFLQGINSGSGFGASSTWDGNSTSGSENARVSYPGLSYSGLTVAGGKAGFRGNFRRIYRPTGGAGFASYLDGSGNIGADGTDLWFSFLLARSSNATSGGSFGVSLLRDAVDPSTTADEVIYFSNLLGGGFQDLDTHMIAVHMEFAAGNDTYTVYVDPDLSLAPTGGVSNSIADLSFDMIKLEGRIFGSPTSDIRFDEVRFGETAVDLGFAPVPEPSTYALLLFACTVFYIVRKKMANAD